MISKLNRKVGHNNNFINFLGIIIFLDNYAEGHHLVGSDLHVCFTWEERREMELQVLREKSGDVLTPMLRLRHGGKISWIFYVSALFIYFSFN